MKGKTVTFIVNFPGGTSTMQGKVKEVAKDFILVQTSSDDAPYQVSPDQVLGVHQ